MTSEKGHYKRSFAFLGIVSDFSKEFSLDDPVESSSCWISMTVNLLRFKAVIGNASLKFVGPLASFRQVTIHQVAFELVRFAKFRSLSKFAVVAYIED